MWRMLWIIHDIKARVERNRQHQQKQKKLRVKWDEKFHREQQEEPELSVSYQIQAMELKISEC